MKLSVRLRLTLVVAVLTGALAAAAAIVAPNVVERVLVGDVLDAAAEEQSLIFESELFDELGVADIGLDEFGLDEFGLDEFGIDLGSIVGGGVAEELSGSVDVGGLIALGGGDELLVALGGSSFVAVDEQGGVTPFRADVDAIDQPVLSIFEVGKLDPFGLGGERFPEAEVATGVRRVDGVDYIVFGDVGGVEQTVSSVRTVLWLATPVAVALAALLAWTLASRALHPVRAITEQAATISGGTLHARVPVPTTGDEVADLATTVNAMLDRLEDDDRRRRQFVSDASHELRSPVAVMRSEAEVALRDPDSTGVEELAGAVAAESGRLATIIDDLLALARHDEGLPPPGAVVDLDDVVLAEAARARRVEVDASRVSAGRVPGRVDELTRLVGHLLDNAARHADSRVAVSLQTTNHAVSLVVDDDGPGVPVDARRSVFERFVRLDEARSRDEGGAGLGLAVVASIAERSGGAVTVGDSDFGGARFTVTWPAGVGLLSGA